MDVYAQNFGDVKLDLILVERLDATSHSFTLGGNMGNAVTTGDFSQLESYLGNYLLDTDLFVLNNTTKEYMSITAEMLFEQLTSMVIGEKFLIYTTLPLYYAKLVDAMPSLVNDGVIFDEYSALSGEIKFFGTIGGDDINLISAGLNIMTSSSATILRGDVLDYLHEKTQEIPTPTTFSIISGRGYPHTSFTIDRWSNYELPSQYFAPSNISCTEYDIDSANSREPDDYLDFITFACITPPSPVQEDSEWVRVETTIDGNVYDAYVYGNIVDGLSIGRNTRNKGFLNAIFNKFKLIGEGYYLDTDAVKIPLTVYYI